VCTEWEDVINLGLPAAAPREFFFVAMCMTLHWNHEALSRMAKLNDVFPRSSWLVLKAGTAHYNLRKMEEAKVRWAVYRCARWRWPSHHH
jgi:hypothetical protein